MGRCPEKTPAGGAGQRRGTKCSDRGSGRTRVNESRTTWKSIPRWGGRFAAFSMTGSCREKESWDARRTWRNWRARLSWMK